MLICISDLKYPLLEAFDLVIVKFYLIVWCRTRHCNVSLENRLGRKLQSCDCRRGQKASISSRSGAIERGDP